MSDLLSGHTCLACGGHITASGCFCDDDGEWVECSDCAGTGGHHDCGEDTCVCAHPEDTSSEDWHACEFCDGEGGWNE